MSSSVVTHQCVHLSQSWLGRPEKHWKSKSTESSNRMFFYLTQWYIEYTNSVHVYISTVIIYNAHWLIYVYIYIHSYTYVYIYSKIHVYLHLNTYIRIRSIASRISRNVQCPEAPDRYASRMPSHVSWTEKQVGFHLGFGDGKMDRIRHWLKIGSRYGVWVGSHQMLLDRLGWITPILFCWGFMIVMTNHIQIQTLGWCTWKNL